MEAVPRLPMINFELNVSTENASFGPKLKPYIVSFYHEDGESYSTEIYQLETLRAGAVRPSTDVNGCQMLKKYYCQLHFLKSRFPMEEGQPCAVYFSWKNPYSAVACKAAEIQLELMAILYNIGALHTKLGAADSRVAHDGMKMACTHFQCAAWAFQTVRESYPQMINSILAVEIVHFMQQVCLAQAQECILEKSMMDNRKPSIIAKVAVQVVDYYKSALHSLQVGGEDGPFSDIVGSRVSKEWLKYLLFKVAYHKCIALLFQGQQAEEQQKMGERVSFYQAACEHLEEAVKLSSNLPQQLQQEVGEALAFTTDVVEGKRKAAKNENEFIYHEEVPDRDALQEVKGASLVKGIPFSVNDVEVSGNDIFARLVPMEAHEAASLYSEKKAQMLRKIVELIENKDHKLAEFMSSLQLDVLSQMRQASGLSQDLVDRAAALSARPTACKDLVDAMANLSNTYHEVEAMLKEIQGLLDEEEKSENEYQQLMGKRPPSIIATDLAREAAKYKEAHSKASESNQTLHRAMTTHVANLKILAQPLAQLQHQIPSVVLPNKNVDEDALHNVEALVTKVEEMRSQRAMLWAQLREAAHNDDITSALVTRQPDQSPDDVFQRELQKHNKFVSLIEQNTSAQENILTALVEAYAKFTNSRRYLQDIVSKRNNTISALIASYDTYDDLLDKANKGIQFYNKLETNVSKLLQRIKSASKVQEEEREQLLAKNTTPKPEPLSTTTNITTSSTPKLKDYLDSMKKDGGTGVAGMNTLQYPSTYPAGIVNVAADKAWPPGVRPAPLGSEMNADPALPANSEQMRYANYGASVSYSPAGMISTQSHGNSNMSYAQNPGTDSLYAYGQRGSVPYNYVPVQNPSYSVSDQPQSLPAGGYSTGYSYSQVQDDQGVDQQLAERMAVLSAGSKRDSSTSVSATDYSSNQYAQYGYNSQTNPTYSATNYSYPAITQAYMMTPSSQQYIPQSTDYTTPPVNYTSVSEPNPAVSPIPNYQSGTSQLQTGYQQYPKVQVDSSAAYSAYDGTAGYSSYTPHSYGSPAVPVTGVNCVSYSTNVYNQQTDQQSGYNAPYVYDSQNLSYGAVYSGSEQNISVSDQYNYDYAAYQPSANVQNPQVQDYSASNTSLYVTQNTYPYYTYEGTAQVYPTTTVATYVQPQVTAVQSTINTQKTEEPSSNIDLLAGLDFNVSQEPLTPQQSKKDEPKPADEKELSKVKAEVPSTLKQVPKAEEKQIVIKRPEIKLLEVPKRNLLENSETFKLFVQEVEKYEKFVDVLTKKTLNGPTTLEVKWKEIQDKQDVDVQKRSISVARCYPMKNRFPDILPYDYTRVELASAKDDYINASFIKDVTPYTPLFIVTQAPTVPTFPDFWTMVREQQVEIIVCLLCDNEVCDEIYWPKERGQEVNMSDMVISAQSVVVKSHWTERLFSVVMPEQRESRVVLHLQFTAWPGSLFPTSPDPFISFVKEVITLQQQQRVLTHPIIVHCLSGVGRSGLFCLLTSAILDLSVNPTSIPDLTALAVKISSSRKNVLRDREHLKFAYQAFLQHLRNLQMSQLKKKQAVDGASVKQEVVTESEEKNDPLSSLDPFWASKKGN